MAQIDLQRVSKRYASGLPLAIQGVNLQVAPGEFCVFVGPSGCGKSTLLRMVAGLEDITEGELRISGQRMNETPAAQRGVAMVFQSYALYPHMTVYDNMAFGLQVGGVKPPEVDRKVRAAADVLQITPLLQRLPRALSGGQRQRVAIGRAIVKQPRVFLFDEPLSNLDAALRAQTRLEIARLHREVGSASMVYVTHDQVEAMTLAQKIVLLHTGDRIASHGSVAQVGTPMDLYHRPCSRFVAEFMGSPRINLLGGVLRSAGEGQALVDVAGQLLTVAVDAGHLAPGAAVHVAIRPEHVLLGSAPAAAPGTAVLQARLQHLERLGESSLLYLALAAGEGTANQGTVDTGAAGVTGAGVTGAGRAGMAHAPLLPLTVRVEGHAEATVGDAVVVSLRAGALHLFDSDGQACRRTVVLPQ